MAVRSDGTRSSAERRFDKAQHTTREAKAHIDAESKALRAKTSRLRSLRLAKEEADRESKAAADQAAAEAKKKRPAPKKRATSSA